MFCVWRADVVVDALCELSSCVSLSLRLCDVIRDLTCCFFCIAACTVFTSHAHGILEQNLALSH